MKKTSKKSLLIYAHYYYPDVASTAQILQELAESLSESFDVKVISAVPSYGGTVMKKYQKKAYYIEEVNGVTVIRVKVPSFDKNKKFSRVKNILAYFFRAACVTRKAGKADVVFAVSQPPVLGGLLGVWGSFLNRAKLVYNIQDFNPEQISATNYSNNKLMLKLLAWIDKRTCRKADKVIVVGRDMAEVLAKRFWGRQGIPGRGMPAYSVINNWVNEKEVFPLPKDDPHVTAFREQYDLQNKFVIMYSGNLGLYYDLENILSVIADLCGNDRKPLLTHDGRRVAFVFVGEGVLGNRMKEFVRKRALSDVVFIPYQNKENLNYSLNAADVHWCINAKGIKGVSVPSKIYGILAAGKPIIGVQEKNSEAYRIVEKTRCGLLSEPGDREKLFENVNWFIEQSGKAQIDEMGKRGREYLVDCLTKEISVGKYKKELNSL